MPRVVISVLAFIVLSVFPGHVQDGTTSKCDEFMAAEMQRQRIPGAAIAVVKNGHVILAKGYGYANVEYLVPVKAETIFESGSIGKQFTATAVMMLVEEGKVKLDEKISTYLGEVPATWQNITVRHLLTHTSGLTDYPEGFDFRRDYTEDELLKIAQKIKPAFQPGEKWQYSNLAYVTLGILIHRVSGQFYGDFLQERVFKPLGMNTTRIINEADIIPNRAAGYRFIKDQLKNQSWVSPSLNTTADGSLYFTVLDLAKWDAALYGDSLLKRSSLQQMWTPVRLNDNKTYDYGFGWSLSEINGHQIVEHGGAWQGFTTYIARFVDDKLTVIVLDNLAGANPGKIAHRIAAIYNPDLTYQAISDKEPAVTAFVRELEQRLSAGNTEQDVFTEELRKEFFPARSDRMTRILKALGDLNKIELVERRDKPGYRVYRYRLTFQNSYRFLRISFTPDNKIADLQLIDDF